MEGVCKNIKLLRAGVFNAADEERIIWHSKPIRTDVLLALLGLWLEQWVVAIESSDSCLTGGKAILCEEGLNERLSTQLWMSTLVKSCQRLL